MKKVYAFIAVSSASAINAFGAMTADPDAGLEQIETFADSAIGIAIGIGVVVVGWGYVKRLVKKG